MNALDIDAYMEALGQDVIIIGGETYPLKQLTFQEALAFSQEAERADLSNPEEAKQFVTRFAEASGLPIEVLDKMSAGALAAAARFFTECQRFNEERYVKALGSSRGATTSSRS